MRGGDVVQEEGQVDLLTLQKVVQKKYGVRRHTV